MDAIINACETGTLNAQVAVVISSNPEAEGLKKAKAKGITTFGLNMNEYPTKKEYEDDIIRILKGHNVELICLAGYMRVIGTAFIAEFKQRILNIHPSLLPAFKGLNAQKQALDYGVQFSGCTVHYVEDILDSGPVILQDIVPVLNEDTQESLSKRILEKEHKLYPKAIQQVIETKTQNKTRKETR